MSTIKVKFREKDGALEVRVLINHPMETGMRKLPDGEVVPAHYIKDFLCEHNGDNLIKAYWGPAVAKNPFFSFMIESGKKGDQVKISWSDNLGGSDSQIFVVE